jgi:hypothetical protein
MANRKIESLLVHRRGKRSDLSRLLDQSALRSALSAQLRALLPEDARDHCEVATVQGPLLTILVQNAAWATRLRFMLPELLSKLNQLADFGGVRDIRIRIAPHLTPVRQSLEGRTSPRPPDAPTLEQFASDIEYGELRDAILRLARHGKPSTDAQS